MAHHTGTNGDLTIYGPGDLIAGRTDDARLAATWCALLKAREDDIRAALEADDDMTAGAVWADVEGHARRAVEMREVRHRLDWSQERMADALDVSQAAVSYMETGERPINFRTLLALRSIEARAE